MIVQGAAQFAALVVASVIAAEALVLTRRHPPFGLWLLMAFTLTGLGGWRFETVIAGFQVYPLDLVSVLLVTVSLLRLRNLETLPRPIILISVLLALAIARGVSELGTATAMNGARGFIYVFAAVVFARVCLIGRWSSIESVWLASAALLGVVATLFVARNGLGTYSASGERPLNSGQALIVAQASLLALTTNRPGRWNLAAVAGFGLVLLSQQRTVWVATLAMALVLASRPDVIGNRSKSRRVRLGLGAALMGSVALVMFSPSGLRNDLTTATSDVSADKSTFSWRTEGWLYYLDDFGARSLGDKLVGQPSGRVVGVIDNFSRTASAHNMYVQMMVAVGLLGLAALVIMYVVALQKSWWTKPPLAAIIVGLCVFSIGYQIESVQGIWIGFALPLVAVRKSSTSPAGALETA